jgi:NitT/TauT family transport system ATP-binding protein
MQARMTAPVQAPPAAGGRFGALHLRDVVKAFAPARRGAAPVTALDGLSLDAEPGEFVAVVGPSGCGKSTLLDIVAGLTKPDAGRVLAEGQLVAGPGRQRLVMFQESALFPWLNAFGNVMFGLKLRPDLTNARRREIAWEHLRLVGLENFARAHVHELSGGMKQRVALARALAPDPQVLLMDEPFSALDALTRDQLCEDLQRIWAESGKTILFVTHNVREAVCLADRVVLLAPRPGRIAEVFDVPLPRPRDIHSIELAKHAADIAAVLKATIGDTARQ